MKNAHHILAPRPVFMLGTISERGTHNIIPVSNITQISYEPSQFLVAIYKKWDTSNNLRKTGYCSVAPLYEDYIEVGWKLGAKYSGWKPSSAPEKLESIDVDVGIDVEYGVPFLANCYPMIIMKSTNKLHDNGDHDLYVLEPVRYFESDKSSSDTVTPPSLDRIVFQITRGDFGVAINHTVKQNFFN